MNLNLKKFDEEISLGIADYEKCVTLMVEPQKGSIDVYMTPNEARQVAREIIRLADAIEEGN